ncbi:MAG: amino acid ABC transporter permease [Acidimicrobiia bacterium]
MGLRTTLSLSLLSFTLALVGGALVAAMRVSPLRLLRAIGAVYVELFFSLPLLVWALLFFFGLPKVGIVFDRFPSAVIVLAVFTAALCAEAIRAGINTVPPGQGEAARAIGLRFDQVLTLVVLPQALRTMVGPLGSVFLALIRNSAVVALALSVDDLMWRSDQLNTDTARPVQVLLGTFVAYLVLTVPGTLAVNWAQRRWAFGR